MRRKIQKLQEYVQVNPAKIPKVCACAELGIGCNLAAVLLAAACSLF
jgi:hypothetical protein